MSFVLDVKWQGLYWEWLVCVPIEIEGVMHFVPFEDYTVPVTAECLWQCRGCDEWFEQGTSGFAAEFQSLPGIPILCGTCRESGAVIDALEKS